MAVSVAVCEIFNVKEWRDLELRLGVVQGVLYSFTFDKEDSDRVWQERFLVTRNPLPNSRVQRLLSEDKKLGYRRGCAMLLRFFLTLNNVVTLKSGLSLNVIETGAFESLSTVSYIRLQ